MMARNERVIGKRRAKRKQRVIGNWKVYLFVYLLIVFFPLLLIVGAGVSSADIDSSFLGGFITGSGIFAGFTTASAISRRKGLEFHHYLLLLANTGLFFIVLNVIFIKHILFLGRPDLFDFGLVMVTVNANGFTAMVIALRLLFQKLWETIGPLFEALVKAFQSAQRQEPPPPPPPP